jgi:hypothetical protein
MVAVAAQQLPHWGRLLNGSFFLKRAHSCRAECGGEGNGSNFKVLAKLPDHFPQ